MLGLERFAGLSVLAAAFVSGVGTVADTGSAAALGVVFSAALAMLWGAQRRQRAMLIETIQQAKTDRDECRSELHELKEWIALNFETRPKP